MTTTRPVRRSFRRRAVQLEVSIHFKPPPSIATTGVAAGLTLVGRTRNLSEGGMALVVSASNIDRYLKRPDSEFAVTLKLPGGPVELQAAPVYYKRFSSGGAVNYLIGSCFVKINDRQLAPLVRYLRSLPPPRQTD